jgi:hypothetical protein
MTFKSSLFPNTVHQKRLPLFTISLHWNTMSPGRQWCVFSGIQFSWSLAPSISLFAKGWCKHPSIHLLWMVCKPLSYYCCMWKGLLDSNDGILQDHSFTVVLSLLGTYHEPGVFTAYSYLIFSIDILWMKNMRLTELGRIVHGYRAGNV